ncbi:MAG TPA: hypothetical protein PKW50_10395 [Syntrophomonas sp.]|nr:hypothetical protein [Syntrophomonas sp.]
MMEKILSEKESLELINSMISSARNNLQKGTGNIFLLWGYVIALLALANLVLLLIFPQVVSHYAYCVWFATPLGIFGYFYLLRQNQKIQIVTTYVDKVLTYVWIAFGISVLVLVVFMLLYSIPGFRGESGPLAFMHWVHWFFMIPFMLMLYGFALFVSGLAYGFKPLVIGAVICWACTLILSLLTNFDHAMEIQLVSLILSVIAGFIIPGHLLTIKEKKHVP